MKHEIYIVGMGPGSPEKMTEEARDALLTSDTIIGYPVYLDLLREQGRPKQERGALACALEKKEFLSTPMRREEQRCRLCFEESEKGKTVSMVCSGDAGVYGMASLMYEIGREYPDASLTVIPGVTAALSGASLLGAPVSHDFCIISLSDLLTPWEKITQRLRMAALADFVIVLYNPASHLRPGHLRRACDILLENLPPLRPCGYVEYIGREGEAAHVCTLEELGEKKLHMFATVFIGNSTTEFFGDKLVTKRGYPVRAGAAEKADEGAKEGKAEETAETEAAAEGKGEAE